MQKLFYSILFKIKEENDDNFSWIKLNYKKIENTYHSHKNIFKEKNSIHKRLYYKISNSLEKKILISKNHTNFNIFNNNTTKDSTTLIAINIDNNNINNNIKKSSSYAGMTDIRVRNKINGKTRNISNNQINSKRDYLEKKRNSNNIKLEVKRCPTTIKLSKINNLIESNINSNNNTNNNDKTYFSNNIESIKNMFLRNNKILYTSPDILLDLKQKEKLRKKTFSDFQNMKIIRENNQKILNRNITNPKNESNFNHYSNKKIKMKPKKAFNVMNSEKNNNAIFNRNNKILNFNNNYFMNYNHSNVKKNNVNNFIHTYNGENINIELEVLKKINRINSTTSPSNQMNSKKRKNIIKNKSLKNQKINLNIKLINNNNYNNAPLMIFNCQTNTSNNNIKNLSEKKKLNLKNRNAMNKIEYKLENNKKPINNKRIIKYKIQRNTIKSDRNSKENSHFFLTKYDSLNKIKIMNYPKNNF